jgi:hypothetical protein
MLEPKPVVKPPEHVEALERVADHATELTESQQSLEEYATSRLASERGEDVFSLPAWLLEQLMNDPELEAGTVYVDVVNQRYLLVPELSVPADALEVPEFLKEQLQAERRAKQERLLNPCLEIALELEPTIGPAYIDGQPTGRTLLERQAPIAGPWQPLLGFFRRVARDDEAGS